MSAKRALYSGKVQGVGFRYTVKRIASGFEVVGSVKNLPDGRVEVEAMSHDDEELEAFFEEIQNSALGGNIKEVEMLPMAPLVNVRGFTIVS